MGTWFFASATGNFAAGLIASATGSGSLETAGGEMLPGSAEAIAYMTSVSDVYTKIGWLAVGAGVVIILISPVIKKLMHLDTLQDAA
jgi:POT family proton-dependent oligopeptide transporter